MRELLRHIEACRNARLPGDRLPFRLAGAAGPVQVGWVRPAIAETLAGIAPIRIDRDGVTLTDPAALPALARDLAERGLLRWRDEEFDVRADQAGAVLARVDRGALPVLGIVARGVHVNGLVRRGEEWLLWIGRRAADKALDPGKLDHLVAGGVPAGMTLAETLVKEAAEEASLPATMALQAREVGRIGYAMERPEGLRRDLLHCYDLYLPADFIPVPGDDEVEHFQLWSLTRVLETAVDTDAFKFNVNLVLIDLFLRTGLIPTGSAEAALLRRALDGS